MHRFDLQSLAAQIENETTLDFHFLNKILLLLSVCSKFSFRVFAGFPKNLLLHLLVKNISLFLDRLPFCRRAILDLGSMILETIEFVAGR
jgi:hypothetical protein